MTPADEGQRYQIDHPADGRVSVGGTAAKGRAKCLGCGSPVELAQERVVRVTRCWRCP